MNKPDTLNIELMFRIMLAQSNKLIDSLKDMDPSSDAYGNALSNLAKMFAILGGTTINQDGKK